MGYLRFLFEFVGSPKLAKKVVCALCGTLRRICFVEYSLLIIGQIGEVRWWKSRALAPEGGSQEAFKGVRRTFRANTGVCLTSAEGKKGRSVFAPSFRFLSFFFEVMDGGFVIGIEALTADKLYLSGCSDRSSAAGAFVFSCAAWLLRG